MRLILIAVLMVGLVGCGGEYVYQETPPGPKTYIGIDVERVEDTEKDVTCWVFRGINKGGLSCIPNAQLKQNEK